MATKQYAGFGLGLRAEHYDDIVETRPKVDWFEIVSEDFMVEGGSPLYYLDKIRQDYPMVMHGVSMSIGSTDPLNWDYLKQLKQLIERVEPLWVSDHLCWTGVDGVNVHDLMPVPHTQEALRHVVDRVKQVQDFLGRQILLENPSSYVTYKGQEMLECELMKEIACQADCLILLDVNNIYVSAFNHGFDPEHYLNTIPVDRVQQFHIAGHTNCETHIIDTHDEPIIDGVWDLYAKAVGRFGKVSTLLERDANIPPLSELMLELNQAKTIYNQVMQSRV